MKKNNLIPIIILNIILRMDIERTTLEVLYKISELMFGYNNVIITKQDVKLFLPANKADLVTNGISIGDYITFGELQYEEDFIEDGCDEEFLDNIRPSLPIINNIEFVIRLGSYGDAETIPLVLLIKDKYYHHFINTLNRRKCYFPLLEVVSV